MEIQVPTIGTVTERMEWIKMLQKVSNHICHKEDAYSKGQNDAIRHMEMCLSGVIKSIRYGKDN